MTIPARRAEQAFDRDLLAALDNAGLLHGKASHETRSTAMATIEQARAFGYESVRLHTEQLAVARWGRLWSVLDMTGDMPAQIGQPTDTRYAAMYQADRKVSSGDYR